MPIRTTHKASLFAESFIREMTRLFLARQALPGVEPGVNLAQGFPDFPAPEAMKEAACRAIREDVNPYAITWGARSLRQAIADKTAHFYGVRPDPDREITVACGATEAMMAAMLAVVNPGDEVIVFEPFYEDYGPDAVLSGAPPRFVALHEPDWRFDPEELAAAFNDGGDHHQHAEQPDGQGLHAGGIDADRGAVSGMVVPVHALTSEFALRA